MQIGNAVIDDEADLRGMYDYLVTHALISDVTWNEIQKYCDFSANATAQSSGCISAADDADDDVSSLDLYNNYASLCTSSTLTSLPKKASVSCILKFIVSIGCTYQRRVRIYTCYSIISNDQIIFYIVLAAFSCYVDNEV